ncbi:MULTISPECIES: GNAT family N-acetyltransferase [Aureimonas]|uniref:Arsenate reductase n=2 Tax=Aureimonas TaxID=414371 RepID=A0A1H0HEM0_9HYPH|nr:MULTISPECIES: GNAT family N-acetyltransferase [Aureimonas]MBB3934634.1 N-acetylglutamate synthase-like GNAT family acetyltransferase [Aureimonas phyllosphaerae]MBB3950555.1 N-acetylglutamate synthase-like GNAT family acetyltransferase [Aureimonas jatrophae]MBB3958150.1 N-acetylglutamate synthase-like GNAT family acetyltransferase [Aureimonas phyllosphaerae]SDO17659.1 arsenate reductase [Aureimonas jatrophae]SFE92626.1 arsenate reductase [Aureimonas phyllosphaerae]
MTPALVTTAVDDSAGLVGLLSTAGLPTEDVTEPGRVFLRYATEDGEFVGIGGFEPLGSAVLLRSIAVVPEHRGRGVGGAITADLMERGRVQGAADAFAFTTGERTFLAALGFQRVERTKAPAAVLATRQATGLCAASAVLWWKKTGR